MGFKFEIGDRTYEAVEYTVQEAATPLAAGDSSGQVGTFSISLPVPDPDINPNHPVTVFGPQVLVGESIRIVDTRKGFTLGRVESVSQARGNGSFTVNGTSRLGLLNVYGIQAQPFAGSLADAFEYYLSLANVTTDLFVDSSIATDPVVFPGWNGELWFNLKQMAAAIDCDISLVSGIVLLRPIRSRIASRGRDIDRSVETGGGQLALNVEVYQYNNRVITNELVYPPGGWSEEVTVITVNAGETVEEVIELSASVSSITQPVMQTFVSRTHDSSSVFTVVGDDGLPIDPAQWTANGGSLVVSINPDTVSLTVRVTAPTGLPNASGELIGVYGIALSDTDSTGRYSTLRILGSGVAFDKQLVRIPTGVSPLRTSTEVGVTIDNPFISTREQLYRAGTRAAKQYTGRVQTLSGSVVSINRLGDSGQATYPTYADVQAIAAGRTYAQMQTEWGGMTYGGLQAMFFETVRDNFENQVFGNVAGARIWDAKTRRWYRIRSGTLNASSIQFNADDDLLYSDVQAVLAGKTYAQVQALFNGFAYAQVALAGAYNGGN